MIRAAALLFATATSTATTGAEYGRAFVDAFAAACVPQRMSYPGTMETARAAGWTEVGREDHAELAAMIGRGEAILAAEADLDIDYEQTLFARDVEGTRHHLVVARSSIVMDEDEPDDPWVFIGCYLYNFDAVAPIDPAPVTALIGKPISNSVDDQGMVGHVWGPPCPMPRTGDTYMSFIAEDSPHAEMTGFSGLTMKFETSEPDPGEVVPETYC